MINISNYTDKEPYKDLLNKWLTSFRYSGDSARVVIEKVEYTINCEKELLNSSENNSSYMAHLENIDVLTIYSNILKDIEKGEKKHYGNK